MSELSKQALRVDNNQSFPNNNAGLITPTALRGFNENMIDSNVNQTTYTADSASFNSRINALSGSVAVNTGSLLTTASAVGNVMTFTKGDASTFNVTVGSVIPSGTISGSQQITALGFVSSSITGSSLVTASFNNSTRNLTFTKGDTSQFSVNIPDVSGSAINTGSFATTGSNQFIGNQAIDGTLTITNKIIGSQSLFLQPNANDFRYLEIYNTSPADTHITASGGELFLGNDETYVLVNTNANQKLVVIRGDEKIVASGSLDISGSLTSSLQQGFVLVGNASGRTQSIPTSSIQTTLPSGLVSGSSQIILQQTTGNLSGSRIDGLVASASFATTASFALNAVIQTGSFATTGSNTFVGNQTITGSINISGSINMVNGADLVTHHVRAQGSNGLELQTSAGTAIVAMGQGGGTQAQFVGAVSANSVSASTITGIGSPFAFSQSVDSRLDAYEAVSASYARTNVNNTFSGNQTFNNITVNGTASINFLETVTGSAKIIGDAFIILNNNTPIERYAGIIVLDSGSVGTSASFQFDGQTNDWFYEYTGSDPLNFGVALFGPEYGTKGSPIYNTSNRVVKGDGGHHILDSNISDDGSTVSINSNTQVTGSLLVNGQSVLVGTNLSSLNAFTQSAQGRLNNIELTTASLQSSVTNLNSFTSSQQGLNATFATTGSNNFIGNQTITGSLTISGSATTDLRIIGQVLVTGSGTTNANISQTIIGLSRPNGSGTWQSLDFGGYLSAFTADLSEISMVADGASYTANWTNGPAISVNDPADSYPAMIGFQNKTNWTDGRVTVLKRLDVSGSVNIQNTLTSSLQQGYVWVGDANGRTTTVSTGSFGGGGSAFPFTGSAQITGSLGLTGSISEFVNTLTIASSTASVNFNDGNMFTLTLVTGSVTHITPTNIRRGQTINIQINQPAGISSGSVSFSPNVLFPGGADYQATATGSAIDLLTFVSLDGTNVLAASIKNFQ